jgi:hypothetical protein
MLQKATVIETCLLKIAKNRIPIAIVNSELSLTNFAFIHAGRDGWIAIATANNSALCNESVEQSSLILPIVPVKRDPSHMVTSSSVFESMASSWRNDALR